MNYSSRKFFSYYSFLVSFHFFPFPFGNWRGGKVPMSFPSRQSPKFGKGVRKMMGLLNFPSFLLEVNHNSSFVGSVEKSRIEDWQVPLTRDNLLAREETLWALTKPLQNQTSLLPYNLMNRIYSLRLVGIVLQSPTSISPFTLIRVLTIGLELKYPTPSPESLRILARMIGGVNEI